jgi:hypothetical protein
MMAAEFKAVPKRLKAGKAERKGQNTMQGKQIIHLAIFERSNFKSPFDADIKTPNPFHQMNYSAFRLE